ncbi:glycosyl-transferase for dystroglycan-domain-containing protein [Baffinella frigidus]|nr:glycosyl-transferase for dystroglycan-domain-containing protein [Cryptophyta sp. CCMP2293]
MAFEPVRTKMVFLLDIDLIPDAGFYRYVMGQYQALLSEAGTKVFTIPAFQGVSATDLVTESEFPVDKEELMGMLTKNTIKPILSGKDEFWEAFKCLNYDAWYTSSEYYLAEYRWPCEPYLLGATDQIPLYDERFVYYGNDKAQHVLNLFYRQFRFAVLPAHFLIHWPHKLAEWADQKERNSHIGEGVQVLELTENFKFETGTEAGVNWHTGVKFSPGTYRVKDGVKIVWNGKEWINEATGVATDPLA